MRGEVLDDELAPREVELTLVEAPLDQLVERDIRLLLACVLGRRESDVPREEERRVEEHELRDELRRACRELEREAATERMADEDRLAGADRLDDRREVRADVPRRLPGRVTVAEEVRRQDAMVRQRGGEPREVPAVVADSMQADDARRARLAPLVERERHPVGGAS